MNKQQFINYLKYPDKLDQDSSQVLESLVKEYPYCQTANILLTLSFQNEDNIKFNNQLKLTSAYASDRSILKKLLQESKERLPEAIINKKEYRSADLLTRKKTSKEKPVKLQSNKETDVLGLINRLKGELNEILIQSAGQNEEEGALIKDLEKRLESIQGKLTTKQKPIKTKTADRPVVTEYNFDHLDDLTKTLTEQKPNSELINKFIEEVPKISPIGKPEFFNPVDFAKQSLIDNESIVSETLAEIYHEQGNYTKAIKTYQKLSLLYPEKNIYFAAQIEKIKKEVK